MVALLRQTLSRVAVFWHHEQVARPAGDGSYPHELTEDDKAYLREMDEERRRAWIEAAR